MRRTLTALFAVLISVAVTACGSSSQSDSETTLRLWVSGPEYEDAVAETVAQFEKSNPDIQVEVTVLDWAASEQQMTTGVAGGAAPDVITFHSSNLPGWAENGLLAPSEVDAEEWQESGLENVTYDDQVYGLPWGLALRGFYYRDDLANEFGMPDGPQSWDDLRTYAVEATQHSGETLTRAGLWIPTEHSYKTPAIFFAFLWGNGGEILDDSGNATFNGPEGVEAASYLQELLNEDEVDSPGFIQSDNTEYAQDKVASVIGNFVLGGLEDAAPEIAADTKVIVPPYAETPAVELTSEVVSVTSSSQNPEAAQKLQWALAADGAAGHDEVSGYLPAYIPALESEYATTNPWVPQMQEIVEYARTLPRTPRFKEIEAVIKTAMDDIYLNDADVQDALDRAADEVNALTES